MRVLRRIRSLVSTHAPQPTPADGSAVVARTGKKSIFTRALQGAVVLGAGLALTVGAAVSPQVAVAVTQEGTIAAQQGLATSAANDWQIVSGGYQGNTAADKTADTASDEQQYVRIQKNVVPTDRENEFKIYLSIDRKEDMNEFFEGAIWGVDNNNSHITAPSDGNWDPETGAGGESKVNGQSDLLEKTQVTGYDPIWLEIGVYDGSDLLYVWKNQFWVSGLSGEAKTFFLADPEDKQASPNNYPGLVLGQRGSHAGTEDDPIQLYVDVNWEHLDEIFGGVKQTAVELQSVTDILGANMELVSVDACDGFVDDPVQTDTDGNEIVSWSIEPKQDVQVSEDGWYENVAELVYTVRLDVKSETFKSAGLPADYPSGSLTDEYKNQTNTSAKLTYEVSKIDTTASDEAVTLKETADFTSPVVRGLLYDLVAKKTNEGGSPLTGATFGLYEGDTANDPDAQPIEAVKSDANGIVKFVGLEWGTYSVKEIAAPTEEDVFPYVPSDDLWTETLCYTTNPDGLEKSNVSDDEGDSRNAMKQRVEPFVNLQMWMTSFPLTKYFSGGEWGDDDEFTFSIIPDEGSPSLRDVMGNEVSSVTLSKDDAFYDESQQQWIANTNLLLAGVGTGMDSGEHAYYGYTITEVEGNSDDVVYSRAKWHVVFDVGLNDDGTVHAGQEDVTQLLDDDGDVLDSSVPTTRGMVRGIEFTNRRVSLTFSGLQETKQVIGGDAKAGDFTFSVQAVEHKDSNTSAADAAKLAGLQSLAGNLNKGSYDSQTQTLTFANGDGISVADNAKTVRNANELTLTAANVGHTYVYEYKELAGSGSAWHQQQETVWRVSVAVDWVDSQTKNAIEATLTLEKSTDGAQSWESMDERTYSSANEAHNPQTPLTVSFVNEYGSTLQIVKVDQDKQPLPGATFTVRGTDYSGEGMTTLNEDETVAAAIFENIPDGTYTISEAAPTGYQKINDMTLEIDGDNAKLTWADTNELVGEGAITKKNGIFTITIENYVNPNLPSTGSSGTVLMGGLGTAAIVLAGAWLLKQRGIDLGKFTSR